MKYNDKLPKRLKRVRNVGQLMDELGKLPRSLPIRGTFSTSLRPVIYNNTQLMNCPHLMFDEDD